ncbi:MAG: DUF4268 domain-containing protein [Gammaproteobacteria bacterium]|nr:DUF4268 domain-containing protein [Gammaproteobacteria bacterium]
MTDPKQFGTLERQDVRDSWPDEARHFTPWLADVNNINLLGDALGLSLEDVEMESSVGGFNVDILCRDETGRTVIIENQLEKTDHKHLGQLLTYAAGKDAVVVVWVSTKFTDEHRAALDWLNDKTDESVQFFGAKIEVWQIGDSRAAPKFDVVCMPNEWSKTVRHSGEMNDGQKLHFDYWSGLREHMQKENGKVAPRSPSKQRVRQFALGVPGFRLRAALHLQEGRLVVRLMFRGRAEAKTARWHELHKQKDSIEKEIGAQLEWWENTPAGNPAWMIRVCRENCNISDKSTWGELHKWHHDHLEKFHAVFQKRCKELNPDDWSPEDDGENDEED